MKFFIPGVTDSAKAEQIYQGIKKFAESQMPFKVKNRRIFSIDFVHNGKERNNEVGRQDEDTGEVVFAILETDTVYYVCTPSRGVARGEPMLVGVQHTHSVEPFEA